MTRKVAIGVILIVIITGGVWYYYIRRRPKLLILEEESLTKKDKTNLFVSSVVSSLPSRLNIYPPPGHS